MTPLPEEAVFRRRAGAESNRFGSDYVVLDSSGAMLHGLNPTGARVWELVDGVRSAAEIATEIAAEFRCDPLRTLDDVAAFLTALADKELLEQVPGSRTGNARPQDRR